MFSIVPNPTFTCRVPLSRPDADAAVPVSFVFRHKGVSELGEWLRNAAEGKYRDDVEFLGEIIEGWGAEIVDERGQPAPYGAENLARLLNAFPGAGNEIVLAYRKRLKDARLGN